MIDIPNIKNSSINACRSCDLWLFTKIDCGDHESKFVGTASFDFNKTQRLAIECDQVNFAGYLCSLTIASDRNLKVCGDQAITVSLKKDGGKTFAQTSLPRGICFV